MLFSLPTTGRTEMFAIQGCPIWLYPDGRIEFVADADIDCDGSGGNPDHDRYFQPDTTLHNQGKALNAYEENFIVLPTPIIKHVGPVVLGCKAKVTNTKTGETAFAVVGDIGPYFKVGEISCALAKRIGVDPNPVSGGESAHIIQYEVWPGVRYPPYSLLHYNG